MLFLGGIAPSQQPVFDFDYGSGKGLTVRVGGIEVVRGSMFQYYAPGWTKGYYSSRWDGQTVERIDRDTIQVTYSALGGDVFGKAVYRRSGSRLSIDFDLGWKRSDPVKVELCTALIWQPPFEVVPALPVKPVGDAETRTFARGAMKLGGPAMTMAVTGQPDIKTFDARGYQQDWAEQLPLFWQGLSGIELTQGEPKSVHLEYEFAAFPRPIVPARTISGKPESAVSIFPNAEMPPLIPFPKNSLLDWQNVAELSGEWSFPAGRPKHFDWFESKLRSRFELPGRGPVVSVDGGMSDLQKRPGGFKLVIKPGKISLYGEREEGLRNGFSRLAQIAFVRKGKLVVPTGVIDDEPRTDFRGVHLFVGPEAPAFQRKLWENVLLPLGMNRAVLQCERTEWKTLPGTRDAMTMSQADLVSLFNWYRKQQVEPIPLIQSFGHMEWLFSRGANLDLAYNRNIPYAIDPRKPEAIALVGKLWDEAVAVLRPKMIHVGLDEVDMRGFDPKDPKLVTDLWNIMLPELGKIARRNQVQMMLWGDKALAPTEAVDATHGDDTEQARIRREAIPKGSFIADWHYKAEQNHIPFLKSLQKWKLADLIPVASTWYRPENIRGFGVAADIEGVGLLQTTWAGYESNEANMLKAIPQFSAMVLAADYAWSGRTEKIEELPYRADEVLAKMYNPRPSVLVGTSANQIGTGVEFSAGDVTFRKIVGADLAGLDTAGYAKPSAVIIPLMAKAKEVFIAIGCQVQTSPATPLGSIEIVYQDGTKQIQTLAYGLHVRAKTDIASTFFGPRGDGFTCLRILPKPQPIAAVRVVASDLTVGLMLGGLVYR